MSGFLSSLAARSFGMEAGMRPRLASLFEPTRGANSALYAAPRFAPPVTETVVETEAFGPGTRAQIRSRDAEHLAPGAHAAGAVSSEDPMHEAGEIERDKRSRVASRLIPREANLVTRPSERSLPVPLLRDPATSAVSRRSSAPPRTQDESAQAEASVFAPAASPITQPSATGEDGLRAQRNGEIHPANANAQPTALNLNVETDGNHSLVTPASAFRGLLEQMRNAASALNAAVAAPAKGRPVSSVAETNSAAENSIHVTIGRIEVRAIAENKLERPARSASPVMGLEEYLQRHAQRGGK
jgi:hypothetical protein